MSEIKKVYVVFKSHLDIGYSDSAAVIKQRFLNDFIPAAIATARKSREKKGYRFIWTVGSWLIDEYLKRANPASLQAAETAIRAGDLVWHAMPFTTHTELMNPAVCRYGLNISRNLDRRFGRNTISAKLSDVPGHTCGLVPLLAEAGVKFLHVGINPAWISPKVPPLFVWRIGTSEVIVHHQLYYGLDEEVPAAGCALVFKHKNDNLPPPGLEEISKIYAEIEERYPHAEIIPATLDDFARELEKIKGRLPVVESEIGDSWIFGTGADPLLTVPFRRVQNFLGQHEKELPEQLKEKVMMELLLTAEHSWGLSFNTFLADCKNHATKDFIAARKNDAVPESAIPDSCAPCPNGTKRRYRTFERAWRDKRGYLKKGIDILCASEFSAALKMELEKIAPSEPDTKMMQSEIVKFETTIFKISYDRKTGSLDELTDKRSNKTWFSNEKQGGQLLYEHFCQDDYAKWLLNVVSDYQKNIQWAIYDFGRPGLENVKYARHGTHLLDADKIFHDNSDPARLKVIVKAGFNEFLHQNYGAPRRVFIEYVFPTEEPVIDISLQWFDKTPTRMPEAIWFSFNPILDNPQNWMMEKLGLMISPLHVASDAGGTMHGIDRKLSYEGRDGRLTIMSPDAHLLAPGTRKILSADKKPFELENGMHFCLCNNTFSTNFPLWFGEDMRYNFQLNFGARK